MTPPLRPLDDDQRRRRRNSLALGLILGALVLIFYALTIVKMGPNLFVSRDL